MTKEEIKALIAAKIAGQGNQVDSGGALDALLNAIVDAIPEGGGGVSPVQLPANTDLEQLPEEYYNQILDNIKAGCNVVMVGNSPVTIFTDSYGQMAFFGDYEEPLGVHTVGVEE